MDVFLSYNRREAEHAAALNDWLSRQGVRTFFDQHNLGGGQLWLPDLERRIEHEAHAIAVLVDFTVDAVKRAQLRQFRIVHFTTHFLLPGELRCVDDSAIIASVPVGASNAAGALLTPSDVIGLDLDSDLVVLSGCNTFSQFSQEGRSALVGAFFYAGAHSLMASHWSVNDQTTAFLVADTFRRMVNKPDLGPAGALRDAQLSLLGSESITALAHPFYWAPFTIFGAGGEQVH